MDELNLFGIPRLLKSKFPIGRIVGTPAAFEALKTNKTTALEFLRRHASGDWGVVGKDDWESNDQALVDGTRIFSSYTLDDDSVIWVITEADRSSTTILLPDDY